ncbi:DUF2007 domain-containing protein [Kaustia mangrovi]|uniref:DUF2007 domain-containing protein n=1 Tax=Kaustia mangrovi TaxID=2593653 RepID=A0A7S8C2D6_9HYPH|nr:DUF2007 domain-containing protein [Kaustia mangrovi]QPC42099.1 DUF2007 domain-containing protein [Kaustia mangrovi]
MREILRTNDAVLISYAASLLEDAGIHHAVFDANMSVVEGSLGILPRRLMVEDEKATRAERLLAEAGIGQ